MLCLIIENLKDVFPKATKMSLDFFAVTYDNFYVHGKNKFIVYTEIWY